MNMRGIKSIEEMIDELALSNEIGSIGHIFTRLNLQIPRLTDLPVVTGTVDTADIGMLCRTPQYEYGFVPASGKGFTIERTLMSTLGEALERTLPMINPPRADVYGTTLELKERGLPVLGPDRVHLFAEEQYGSIPFRKFTDRSYIGWVKLTGREEIYAPAQIVAFGYVRQIREELIGYSSSDGLAVGYGLHAEYRGVLEVVERDAINLGWHCDIPPLRVNIPLREALELVGLRPRPLNLKFHVFLWRTDIENVYVVSVHFIADREVYAYMPGCGAGMCFEEALAKAIAEAGQAYMNMYNISRLRKIYGKDIDLYYVDKNAPPETADNIFRIVWYWGYRENLERLYNMFFSRCKITDPPRSNPPERITHKLSQLPKYYKHEYRGIEPLKLVKIFIPELTQYNHPRYPMFGHPRYYNARKILKIDDKTLTYSDLRKIPVPYP